MISYEQRLRRSPQAVFEEASLYFMQQGDLYKALRNLIECLEAAEIPYALIGGLALAQHGFVRMTDDIDILLTPAGLATFKEKALGRGYVLAFKDAAKTFRDTDTGVRIEVITTGEYPGDGLPKAIMFPDPAEASTMTKGDFRVVTLAKLVELKLASGMTAPHRRRDLADVQDLIRVLDLAQSFADQLDPSVKRLYLQLWQELQAANNEER
ncbi:MAG TPA: nucleotidyltransferase family protein [Anaerolineae bacterium]|nr:nucleotidyltransferase family protein [Anaerolineae bacterium]